MESLLTIVIVMKAMTTRTGDGKMLMTSNLSIMEEEVEDLTLVRQGIIQKMTKVRTKMRMTMMTKGSWRRC
jgi:hypothetical protein